MNTILNLDLSPITIGSQTVDLMHQNSVLGQSILNSIATSATISMASQLAVIHNIAFAPEEIANDNCPPLSEIFDEDGTVLVDAAGLFEDDTKVERAERAYAILSVAHQIRMEAQAIWDSYFPEKIVNGRKAARPQLQFGRQQNASGRWMTISDPKDAVLHYYHNNNIYRSAKALVDGKTESGGQAGTATNKLTEASTIRSMGL